MYSFLTITKEHFSRHLDLWFFYGFLATAVLSIRTYLFSLPIDGAFNEYTTISLYLSDLFLLATILTRIILENKSLFLSIYTFVRRDIAFISPFFLLILWSFLSLLWSEQASLTFFRSIKLLEFFLLFLYISERFASYETSSTNCSTWNIFRKIDGPMIFLIFLGTINALIGIIQFFHQKSLGLTVLRESLIGTSLPGVAKIIIDGEKVIRSYGLFPHPNIFAGFLLFTLCLSVFLLFHVEQKWKTITKVSVFIQIASLFLTFSKSAILGLSITFFAIFLSKNGIKSTKKYIFTLAIGLSLLLIGFFSLSSFANLNYRTFFYQPLQERSVFLHIAKEMIDENFFFGVSSGHFVLKMQEFSQGKLFLWQYQPVHNVFLLIMAELGIFGLLFFLFFLFFFFLKILRDFRSDVSRGTMSRTLMLSLCLGFLPILLFDHYLWDIQQGQILFFLTFGIFGALSHVTREGQHTNI